MLMSIFNKRSALLLLIALLTACQSTPEPAPAPEPVVEPAPEVPLEEAAVPEPEPVDFNQQFYEEAVTALKDDKTEIALELLKKVSSDAPDKPFVFTNLGLVYFKMQQLDLAEQAFREAVKRNDDDAVAHNHLGILHRQRGEFEQSRKHYQRAIDIDSDYALAYLNLGILYDIYLQDLKLALKHYQKYQTLTSTENRQVDGWITDIKRQLKSGA